jgi:hypothetical protein
MHRKRSNELHKQHRSWTRPKRIDCKIDDQVSLFSLNNPFASLWSDYFFNWVLLMQAYVLILHCQICSTATFGANIAIPNLVTNMYDESSTMVALPIQGGRIFYLASMKMLQLLGN